MKLTTFEEVKKQLTRYRKTKVPIPWRKFPEEVAKLGGLPREEANRRLINKLEWHFEAVVKLIREDRKSNSDNIAFKVGNLMNYIELTYAMIEERRAGIPVATSMRFIHKDRTKVAEGKRRDYTRGSVDVLQNFKNQAQYFNLRPEHSLAVHMEKQFAAIITYLQTEGDSESEPIHKRIGDCLNYLELYFALVVEDRNHKLPVI